MRKFIYALLFLGAFSSQLIAQNEGVIFFKGTWQEALDKAKKENKIIFLDCYGKWCVPCKEMADTVFTQKAVGEYYNEHFINVTIDVDTKDGKSISQRYNVQRFPTLFFLKPGGYKVEGIESRQNAKELILLGKKALSKADTVTIEERFYNGGYDDPAFIKEFFTYVLKSAPSGTKEFAFNTIIEKKGYEAFLQKKYWDVIGLASTGSQVALYLTAHHSDFAKVYGEDAVNAKIADMYLNIYMLNSYVEKTRNNFAQGENVEQGDPEAFLKFRQRMKDRKLPELKYLNAVTDFYLACRSGKMEEAHKVANAALKDAKVWKYQQMAKLANWLMIGREDDRHMAAKWAQKAVELTKDKTEKEECLKIYNDLSKEPAPSVRPTPRIYGMYM